MHILVVSQYFYPEAFRINDMVQEWVRRGYKVTVLTGIPNYPTGKFYTGYSWTKKRKETWNGAEIIRIPLIARGRSSIGMILNYLSFVVSGWFWNLTNKVNADLVFSFEVSPMTQVKVGCKYARKHKVPHYVYVQDLWPENIETVTGIHSRIVIGPIDRMVDKIYRQVDQIFVTSPSFVEAIVNRKNPTDRTKVHYWPQYAEDYYQPVDVPEETTVKNNTSFKVAFTGNIGTAQGLDILPKTAELLKDDNILFVIVGDGRYKETLLKDISQRGVEQKFLFFPRQNPQKIPAILAECDMGFISFADTDLWKKTIPAKLQSYMACGKGIIASAAGETARIIQEADCGICTEIGSPEALAAGIRTAMSKDVISMGERARDYCLAHFNKTRLMDQMDSYLKGTAQ